MYSEDQINDFQTTLFGRTYKGASISNIKDEVILKRVHEWIKSDQPILTISGKCGTGKTYFCAAMYAYMMNSLRGDVYAHNENSLLRKVRSSMDLKGDYLQALHQAINYDFLIIDDIGSSGYTEWRAEILFELIDKRYSDSRKTLLTSNLSPTDLKKTYGDFQGERIVSRLNSKENMWLSFNSMPDYRQEAIYNRHNNNFEEL